MYSVHFAHRRLEKKLDSFHPHVTARIVKAILQLEKNPRPSGAKKLQGQMKGAWRIRIGDYRVLYDIDDVTKEVVLLTIAHRREVYLG